MSGEDGIFNREHRYLTIGIILAVTIISFEGMAFTTAAPVLAEDLQGMSLYGWVFSAYMLAQILGTVITGRQIGRQGPGATFGAALGMFGTGLVICTVAPNMVILITGRALQGLGAGAVLTCVYTGIQLRYSDALRARILAVFSGAYALPALIGPLMAGMIAELWSWRWIFGGILPFFLLAALLTLPTFRRLSMRESHGEDWDRIGSAVRLTAGAGLLLAGLGWIPQVTGLLLGMGGLFLMMSPLRRLLPEGTFSARKGLPAIVASRGLFTACFSGTESFLVLALTAEKGYTADLAGLIVTSGVLSWTVAAWLQGRLDQRDRGQGRRRRVVVGVAMMTLGIGAAQLVWLPGPTALGFAVGSQILTGFGIGWAHPASSAIAFAHTRKGSEGEISGVLQFTDSFSPGVGIGIGGALVAISRGAGWGTGPGVAGALALQVVWIVMGLAAVRRVPRSLQEEILGGSTAA